MLGVSVVLSDVSCLLGISFAILFANPMILQRFDTPMFGFSCRKTMSYLAASCFVSLDFRFNYFFVVIPFVFVRLGLFAVSTCEHSIHSSLIFSIGWTYVHGCT